MRNIDETNFPEMLKSIVLSVPMKEIKSFSDLEQKAYITGIDVCIEILASLLEEKANILDK